MQLTVLCCQIKPFFCKNINVILFYVEFLSHGSASEVGGTDTGFRVIFCNAPPLNQWEERSANPGPFKTTALTVKRQSLSGSQKESWYFPIKIKLGKEIVPFFSKKEYFSRTSQGALPGTLLLKRFFRSVELLFDPRYQLAPNVRPYKEAVCFQPTLPQQLVKERFRNPNNPVAPKILLNLVCV